MTCDPTRDQPATTRQELVDALTVHRLWTTVGTICAPHITRMRQGNGRLGTPGPRRNAAARQECATTLPGLAHPLSTEGST